MATAKKQPASPKPTTPRQATKVEKDTPTSADSGGDVFDVRRVRRLVQLMNQHGLAEVDLRQGEQRIRLRRDIDPVPAAAAAIAPPSAPAPVAAAPLAAAPAPADPSLHVITSPMVGTYYNAASPDSAPYVKVGDQVGPDTTICIVEAMKVFNEIPAECSGKIMAILVENGEAVEYGQPMFRVQK